MLEVIYRHSKANVSNLAIFNLSFVQLSNLLLWLTCPRPQDSALRYALYVTLRLGNSSCISVFRSFYIVYTIQSLLLNMQNLLLSQPPLD
jgi:hypothetical protein